MRMVVVALGMLPPSYTMQGRVKELVEVAERIVGVLGEVIGEEGGEEAGLEKVIEECLELVKGVLRP
jgi:hypothetical protein